MADSGVICRLLRYSRRPCAAIFQGTGGIGPDQRRARCQKSESSPFYRRGVKTAA